MIITRLWGGLGNQMFQYAFGYAKAMNAGTNLMLDTRFYSDEFFRRNPRFTQQRLKILSYPIEHTDRVNEHNEFKVINILQTRRINQLIRIPNTTILPVGGRLTYVKETRLRYQEQVAKLNKDNCYYDGYWQTEKYFSEYRSDILRQFALYSELGTKFIEHKCEDIDSAVAVHVRLGDYGRKHFTSHYNYVIDPIYYRRAISAAREKINNPTFYVCSNNIERAKELLGDGREFVYVSGIQDMTDLDDFTVMRLCRHHIISNSTFSWWAAWIADQENAFNFAPDIVFGNRDIIPDRWYKVHV